MGVQRPEHLLVQQRTRQRALLRGFIMTVLIAKPNRVVFDPEARTFRRFDSIGAELDPQAQVEIRLCELDKDRFDDLVGVAADVAAICVSQQALMLCVMEQRLTWLTFA